MITAAKWDEDLGVGVGVGDGRGAGIIHFTGILVRFPEGGRHFDVGMTGVARGKFFLQRGVFDLGGCALSEVDVQDDHTIVGVSSQAGVFACIDHGLRR